MTTIPAHSEISQFRQPVPKNFDEAQLLAHADARHSIAKWLVLAYLAVLAVNIGGPFILYVTTSHHAPMTVDDFKNLVLTLGTVTTGLTGILGFVMGYYFKSEADNKTTQKKRGKTNDG
ncbi:hypothetical protein ACSMXN_05275 [Jatrophihabitans sp. DSM 45814]